ncbi:hypothetical protein I141_12274, partial [Pasteurella multocida P1933]
NQIKMDLKTVEEKPAGQLKVLKTA